CLDDLTLITTSHVLAVNGELLLHPKTLNYHHRYHINRPEDTIVMGRVNLDPTFSYKINRHWDYLGAEKDSIVSKEGGRFISLKSIGLLPRIFSASRENFLKIVHDNKIYQKKIDYAWSPTAISYENTSSCQALQHWLSPYVSCAKDIPKNSTVDLTQSKFISFPSQHYKYPVNLLTTNLGRGGAERIVWDIAVSLSESEIPVNLYILWEREPSFELPDNNFLSVYRLQKLERLQKLKFIIDMQSCWPDLPLFAHLVKTEDLEILLKAKTKVVPIVHNAKAGWLNNPETYNKAGGFAPFVIGCSKNIEQKLLDENLQRPSTFIRHLPSTNQVTSENSSREQLRRNFGLKEHEKLICMVGNFRRQKNYEKAISILAELRRYIPAKLVILGGGFQDNGHGQATLNKVMHRILELDLSGYVLMPGSVYPVEPWLNASDVFLNCSIYEGYSMACLEAIHAGLPLVLSNVGGQSEIIGSNICLLEEQASPKEYAETIFSLLDKHSKGSKPFQLFPKQQHLIWSLINKVHAKMPYEVDNEIQTVLFLTNNLYDAGAQRSLVNLLTQENIPFQPLLCIREPIHGQILPDLIHKADIKVWDISSKDIFELTNKVIDLISSAKVDTVVFWNFAAREKLLITKSLELTSIRLIDVSPGSMYFESLKSQHRFAHTISMDLDKYAERLDAFVYKYSNGFPPKWFSVPKNKSHLIPNGVDLRPDKIKYKNNSKTLLIGTTSRLTPVKQIDWLLDICSHPILQEIDFCMHIVGGLEEPYSEYLNVLATKFSSAPILKEHVIFHGSSNDIWKDLKLMDIFILVAEPGGCPNSSLEALAEGIPIIATNSGGASDQIQQNENGFLVTPGNTQEMADKIQFFAENPSEIARMSRKAQQIARQKFSIKKMINSYSNVIKGSGTQVVI
ncbi:glycosyltransferase, partial [Moorena sp. SIO3I6]|uniref:glycosyltransferase n=1 Tax=Moorena sp. SIO3I6 TaxID=2607831 RepID=UPI0013F92204